MVTLAVFKSTTGTVKKMLHAPTLRIYCVKEVPVPNREVRVMMKDWINQWESVCLREEFVRIYGQFWNSPEGCVSVVTDYAPSGSLQNLVASIGALPESLLKQVTKSVLKQLEFMHSSGLTHNGLCCSQILFDRHGKMKLGIGFGHILKTSKAGEGSSLLNSSNIFNLLYEGSETFKKVNLIKEKF